MTEIISSKKRNKIMAIIIDGKHVAEVIKLDLKSKTEKLVEEKNITPGLALMIVGDDPASKVYVASKEKDCKEIGFNSILKRLSVETSEKEVLDLIKIWNEDPEIHGILVQLPLPKHIDESKVILSIRPDKDVDGFHPENFGRLVIGLEGFVSCTPAGVMELLKYYNIETKGKHVVVVGRSNIVGKPVANLLYQKTQYANATVTICHTGTKDISSFTRQADILIAAMGVPKAIKGEDVKEGVVVIDVGVNRIEDPTTKSGTRLVGDVDYESVMPKAYAISPVPGGVGPMTRAMLMSNTFKSAMMKCK